MRRVLAIQASAGLLLGLGACAQILGVVDIPKDAGTDASVGHDGGVDGGHDAGTDGTSGGRDGGHETGVDAAPDVKAGTKRCSPSGLGVETFEDGGWGPAQPCAATADKPICLGGTCVCLPGAGRCDYQSFSRCLGALDAAPSWEEQGSCPGTCNLGGCGPLPPSCAFADADQSNPNNGVTGCSTIDGAAEPCCTSNEVPGGTFALSYDGVVGGHYDNDQATRVVSGFRLDRYEVTVGRFRPFLAALVEVDGGGGWLPEPGSGKHSHLNAGQGLVDPSAQATDGGAVFERGWDPAWNVDLRQLARTPSQLFCAESTWTSMPNVNSADNEPINCLTWVEAYAFCIWDGGFLPSEAEWNYAAAGGSAQREYPWPGTDAGCNQANFLPTRACTGGPVAVGSYSHADGGDSLWMQADMAGNVVEWTLDAFRPGLTTTPRSDVAATALDGGIEASAVVRVQRGGSFTSDPEGIKTAPRGSSPQGARGYAAGVRCARAP